MKKIIALLIMICIILMGCGNNNNQNEQTTHFDDEVIKKGVLTVGISTDYPPFESLDTNGNIIGYDVDMANYLASKLMTTDNQAYTVEFVQLDFSNIISALQVGQVDVGISAFSYDPKRECAFTEPYYLSAQVITVRKDSGINTLADLNGKVVAAGTATVGYEAASEIEGVIMNDAGDYLTQFELLKANQVDAVVADQKVGESFATNNDELKILDETLAEDNLCITVKKGNDLLLAELNKAVEEFVSSGTSEEYKEKWGL